MKLPCALAVVGLTITPVPAAAEFAPIEMAIPFADHGGIRNWRAVDSDTLYIQDRAGHWYRAELLGRAYDLGYSEAIGFDTGPGGRFDKFAAIVVSGRRYALKSLVASGPPLPRKLAREFL